MDDLRNTDNAWMETVTMNFHDETGEILGNFEFEVCSLYKFFPGRKLRTAEPAFTSLTRPDIRRPELAGFRASVAVRGQNSASKTHGDRPWIFNSICI